jgi:hypothetical protein
LHLECSDTFVEGVNEGLKADGGLLGERLDLLECPDVGKDYFSLDVEASVEGVPRFLVICVGGFEPSNYGLSCTLECRAEVGQLL